MQRYNAQDALSTVLYSSENNVDYARRLAQILAHRMSMPVYTSCSMAFDGVTPEEEFESLNEMTKIVMERWGKYRRDTTQQI